MEKLVTGGDTFDRDYLSKLTTCLSSKENLLESQNASWKGMIDYFVSNGTATDGWGICHNNTVEGVECHAYQENNATKLDVMGIIIYEPCNYVSNVAYYHVATEICNNEGKWNYNESSVTALIQGYSTLAWGSAFWHGSHTILGNWCDNQFISLVSYVAYQGSVAHYPATHIIKDLSLTAREHDGAWATNNLTDVFLKQPIDTWQDAIINLDLPQYMVTFSATICNTLSLILNNTEVVKIADVLMDAFNLPQEDRDFITNHYLPELFKITSTIKLSTREKASLALKFAGTVMKLGYAFAWQEWVFPSPFLLKPAVNDIGAFIMPYINKLADFMTGFPDNDPALKHSQNLYPADKRCRKEQPHSKWHEESADGLLDLVYLLDYQIGITQKNKKSMKWDSWMNTVNELMYDW